MRYNRILYSAQYVGYCNKAMRLCARGAVQLSGPCSICPAVVSRQAGVNSAGARQIQIWPDASRALWPSVVGGSTVSVYPSHRGLHSTLSGFCPPWGIAGGMFDRLPSKHVELWRLSRRMITTCLWQRHTFTTSGMRPHWRLQDFILWTAHGG
jgi:hypothetical protein